MASRKAYILLSVTIGLLFLGTLLLIIGMAKPHWLTYIEVTQTNPWTDVHIGLFEICRETENYYDAYKMELRCSDLALDKVSMKQGAAQVMLYLALVGGLIACGAASTLLFILFMSRQTVSCRTGFRAIAVSAFGSLASVLFIFVTIGIFVDRIYGDLVFDDTVKRMKFAYAFFLCVGAAVMYIAGFIVLCITGKNLHIQTTTSGLEEENAPLERQSDEERIEMKNAQKDKV